jgi:hypothetical protein
MSASAPASPWFRLTASIIIGGFNQSPAFTLLASDERLASLRPFLDTVRNCVLQQIPADAPGGGSVL